MRERDHKAAQAAVDKVNARIALGEFTWTEPEPDERLDVSAALDHFMETQKTTLRESTNAVYTGLVEKHLKPNLGSLDIRESLHRDHLLAFIRDKRAEGLATATITYASLALAAGVLIRWLLAQLGQSKTSTTIR